MSCLREFDSNLAYHFSELLEQPFVRPHWIYISLSHKCTYDCQMCGVVKILKGHELATGVVKKALDEISQWDKDPVVLFTGGEPFLRDDIFELIDYSAERGLNIEAVSNGSLIDRQLASRIISSRLKNIAISLDGAKNSTHDSIRKQGSFRKTIDAIKNLTEAKKQRGDGPQISVWTTIMKENVNELSDIIFLARDLGVDCLVYHPVIVTQDDMQNTSPDAPFWIKQDGLNILKEQIDRIARYQKEHGMVAFLHNPHLWMKYFEASLVKKDWKCNPFVFINIGPDGEVRSCGSPFGNLREMSLNECLQSEEAHRARKKMKACQKPCLQTCWAHPESDSLEDIVKDFLEKLNGYGKQVKKQGLNKGFDLLCEYKEILKSHA